MQTPDFWANATDRALRAAVSAFLYGHPLDEPQIATVRGYLREWIMRPQWQGPDVPRLRARVDGLTSPQAINEWLADAVNAGLDPL
jgi:hypothetical protein